MSKFVSVLKQSIGSLSVPSPVTEVGKAGEAGAENWFERLSVFTS